MAATAETELRKNRYDVFISFRGLDTRCTFTSHLYHALSDAGICTFKDDKELWAGDGIQPELVQAIRGSKISVVVFSRGYADSRWCLDELAEIMTSRGEAGQLVIPVFYDVDPSTVSSNTGTFAEAFRKHERKLDASRVDRWREALREAVTLKGVGLAEHGGDEGRVIKYLLRQTEALLEDLKQLDVARFPVGTSVVPFEDSLPRPQTAPDSQQWKYDVFLSFRGTDTRNTFTSHLYNALTNAGINAFLDLDKLPLGEELGPSMLRALQNSRLSVVVLSSGFAESKWCLRELVEAMKSKKTTGQMIIPVFYHVDPGDVRRQQGPFAEAFHWQAERYSRETVAEWREALREVGSLSGHVVGVEESSDEAKIVEKIVREVSNKLNDQIYLPVATFAVGLYSRVEDINTHISADSGGVRFIGVRGIGGIGKTTLAKAIYNRFLHHFEAKCFLADVRTNSERSKDIVDLQEQLLHDVLSYKTHRIKVSNVDEGIGIIRKRLRGQKVLIVLDDVSDSEQVRKLVGERELLGNGSRIIVTTRYQDVLDKIGVDSTYQVSELNDDESLKLFSSNAFGECSPTEEFKDLSKEVIRCTKGVPLALELLGRALMGRSEEQWIDTIQALKTIPNHDLQSKLRISFDALGNDDKAKKLFLDIACYFVGYDKDYVVRVLGTCDLFPEKGIGVLTGRCLLEIDENNKLKMHDLLQDMGREIARERSPDDPGKRSHLCLPKDVLSTLKSHLGTREVEGISLELGCNDVETVSAEAFKPMKRLKLLKLDNVQIDGKYSHISKELRWLCWHHFSSNFIPNDFFMGELVALDMQYSNLIEVWKDKTLLGNLKILNLSHSQFLIKTPDFSMLPNLEELILEDCTELAEVHLSIGDLEKLDLASFKDCTKLRNLPETICSAKPLRIINISGCSKIDKLPDDIGQMGSLAKLLADGTAIAHLPSSIGQLSNLTDLSICNLKKPEMSYLGYLVRSWVWTSTVPALANSGLISSLSGLSSLRVLKLMDCDLLDDMIPADIGSLHSLEDLDLRNNNFCSLPGALSDMTQLKRLQLDDCIYLESLPDMPASLFSLSAINCVSLNRVSASEFGYGIRLFLTNCHELRTIKGLCMQEPDGSLHLEHCRNLTLEFREFLFKDWCAHGRGEAFLPGTEIPEWFDLQTWGSSLSFQPTPLHGTIIKGFTICIIYASTSDNRNLQPYPNVYAVPSHSSFSSVTHKSIAITPQDHMWAFFVPYSMVDHEESSKDVKLSADFGDGWVVKGIGVHIIRDAIPARGRAE